MDKKIIYNGIYILYSIIFASLILQSNEGFEYFYIGRDENFSAINEVAFYAILTTIYHILSVNCSKKLNIGINSIIIIINLFLIKLHHTNSIS